MRRSSPGGVSARGGKTRHRGPAPPPPPPGCHPRRSYHPPNRQSKAGGTHTAPPPPEGCNAGRSYHPRNGQCKAGGTITAPERSASVGILAKAGFLGASRPPAPERHTRPRELLFGRGPVTETFHDPISRKRRPRG